MMINDEDKVCDRPSKRAKAKKQVRPDDGQVQYTKR